MFFIIKEGNIFKTSNKYIAENGCNTFERSELTENEKDQIYNKGYKFDHNGNIISNEIFEKNEMILKYKSLQKEIAEIKAELQDLVDTYESKDESGKALLDARTTVLETRIGEKRKESDSLALEGIQKYGEAVIAEF